MEAWWRAYGKYHYFGKHFIWQFERRNTFLMEEYLGSKIGSKSDCQNTLILGISIFMNWVMDGLYIQYPQVEDFFDFTKERNAAWDV